MDREPVGDRPSLGRGVAVLLALVAACARPGDGGSDTLTILYPGDERILSPMWEMPAKFLAFLPLATTDAEGELVGALARTWEHSPDYRDWTFHLRTDVRWHDGMAFTAHDIAFTHELWRDPLVRWTAPEEVTVAVRDDSTVTLTFRQPQMAPDTWSTYYPRHLLEALDRTQWLEWEYWLRPVGNGPFRYVRHVPRTMVELEANPDFYRGRPAVDRIVLRFGSRQLTELQGGTVDVMHYVDHRVVQQLRRDPRFEVHHHLWPDASWVEAIFWNHRDPILSEARVRRALTLAIDRAEVRALLNLPDHLPILDVLYSGRQFRRGQIPPPLPFDPEEARRLLTAAGWRDADGDGVRERAGAPLRFTAILGTGTLDEQGGAAAVYVQDAFRRIGVQLELQTVDISVLRARLRGGDFQAAFSRFLVPAVIDHTPRTRWWGPTGPTGYASVEAAALFDSLVVLSDPDHIDAVFRALAPIFQADVPVTFLFPQVQTIVAHRRVRGFRAPYRSDPVAHAEHLWLEPRR